MNDNSVAARSFAGRIQNDFTNYHLQKGKEIEGTSPDNTVTQPTVTTTNPEDFAQKGKQSLGGDQSGSMNLLAGIGFETSDNQFLAALSGFDNSGDDNNTATTNESARIAQVTPLARGTVSRIKGDGPPPSNDSGGGIRRPQRLV